MRRNRTGRRQKNRYRKHAVPDLAGYKPRNAKEAAAIRRLSDIYKDHHWGAPADRVIHVKDSLVPDVSAMGKLEELDLPRVGGPIEFPEGNWVAWNPKHPRRRLYVVLNPATKEKMRRMMKRAGRTVPIQQIARTAGGKQARYRLPDVKGIPLGPCVSIVYACLKRGDDDDIGGSSYIHEFGKDPDGKVPWGAIDVSGRLWLCGGDMDVVEAGIVG